MAQPDFSLLNVGQQGFNTPFENLSQVLQVKNQQLAAQSLAEQRDAVADQRRQQTAKIEQENKRIAGASKALQAGGGVRAAVLQSALENDPESVPALTEFFDKADASANAAKKLRQEAKDHEADFLGDIAEEMKKRGATPEIVKLGTTYAMEQFPDYEEGVKRLEANLQGAAPEQVNAFLDHVISLSPSRRQKPQETPMTISEGQGVKQPDGTYKVMLPKTVTPPKADSFDAYLPMYLKERGIPAEAVTTGITDAARRKYEASIRAPQQPDKPEDPLARREKELRIQKLEQELQKAANTPVNEKVEAIKPVLSEITKLAVGARQPDGSYAGGIFNRSGPLANITGAVRRMRASANLDDDTKVYRSLVRGMTPLLARATGHTGVLTELDVERTEELLPGMGFLSSDGKKVAERKIEQFERLIAGQGTEAEKAEIRRQMGWDKGASQDTSEASSLLAGKPDGVYTLSDGSKHTVKGGKVIR